MFESLIADNPADLMCRDNIARSLAAEATLLLQMGRPQEAENRFRRSLDQWQIYDAFAKKEPMRPPSDLSAREARIWTELDLADVLRLLARSARLRPAGRHDARRGTAGRLRPDDESARRESTFVRAMLRPDRRTISL